MQLLQLPTEALLQILRALGAQFFSQLITRLTMSFSDIRLTLPLLVQLDSEREILHRIRPVTAGDIPGYST